MTPKCDICFHKYDLDLHRPKCLPCGHTICKECVHNPALERRCPTCRKDLAMDPGDHPDNIFVIQMIKDEDDEDEPRVKVPKLEVTKSLPLQRGVEAGRRVVQKLQQAVPLAVEALNRLLDSSAAQLRQMEEALVELERATAGDDDVAEEHLRLAAQMEDGARLLSASKCTVLAEEEENGDSWRASLQVAPVEHIVYPLLLQLRTNGQMEKVDDVADSLSSTAYVGPPGITVLRIKKKLDLDEGYLKVNEILQDERRWRNVRCLQNVQGLGSEKLLRVVAPHLEELESVDAVGPSFMQAVERIKSLRRLVVKCDEEQDDYPDLPLQLEELSVDAVKENQLRCLVRMPRLRSLTATNYFGTDLWFPPSHHGRLLWMRVGFNRDHETTMLSLIGSYGTSLRELQIVCGVSEDHIDGFHFPDLDQDLATCDLPALRRLVLVRRSTAMPCPEVDACLLQRRAIRAALQSSGAVDVVCNACPTSLV